MVQLVQRRKKKYINYNSPSFKLKKVQNKLPINIKPIRDVSSFIFVILFFVFFIASVRYVFRSTIFSPIYTITSVRYDSGSVSMIDDPEIYSFISRSLQGNNYYISNYYTRRKTLAPVYDKYPFIENISLFFLQDNTAAVSLSFQEPVMIVYAGDRKFAVFQDYILPIFEQNNIGKDSPKIHLAEYASGLDNIDGLFYRVSQERLLQDLKILDDYLMKPYQLTYLPGADKSEIITADGKVLYFNHLMDINYQLSKIDLLKQHYEGFDSLWQIDLGSLEDLSVIVRR